VKAILFTLFLAVLGHARAQETAAPGQWRSYLAHTTCQQLVARGTQFIGILATGVATYETTTGEYATYTTLNGLSDNEPTAIGYNPYADLCFVGHSSGMLDVFRVPGQFRAVPDVFLSQSAVRKQVRAFAFSPQFSYIAGDFGILAYDHQRMETRFNYTQFPGASGSSPAVQQLATTADSLYAVLENGTLIAGRLTDNLADIQRWRVLSGHNGLPSGTVRRLAPMPWGLFVMVADTAYQRGSGAWQRVNDLPVGNPFGFAAHQERVYLYYVDSSLVYNGTVADRSFTARQVGSQFAFTTNGWVGYANGFHGLIANPLPNGEVVYPQPYFPRHNRCQHLRYHNKLLYVTPCATDGNYSLCFNNDPVHTISFPDRNYIEEGPGVSPLVISNPWWNLGYPVADPTSNRVFASAWDNGIYVFENGKVVAQYDSSNSCLSGVVTDANGRVNLIGIAALAVDAGGTLWTAGHRTQVPLASIAPDGTCTRYPLPPGASDRFSCMLIDDFGRKWMGTTQGGILVWENNQTYRVLTIDNANLPSNHIRCLAQDRNGQIWVGTPDGVTVFFNPQDILFANAQASCPIVDGFCMLRGTDISDIVIDGANRKWVASSNSGLFLFDEGGTRLLNSYAFRQSPILSNGISDLEWVPENGELFIATDRGLISLKLDTAQPKEDNSNLFIYPNPLYLDYTGPVTLDGTTDGAVVKITTVSGLLVRELQSKGGRMVWDGRDVQGRQLRPGVYLALVASPDGLNGGSTKFVVLDKKP
jgi:hypothetical protein